jgi:hypothetical protein
MFKSKARIRLKLSEYFWLVFAVPVIGYGIYKLSYRAYCNHLLATGNTKTIKAVITYDKNYLGNRSSRFSYSYYYEVNGVVYKDNSHHPELLPGDTVEIRYVIDHPNISAPLTQTE